MNRKFPGFLSPLPQNEADSKLLSASALHMKIKCFSFEWFLFLSCPFFVRTRLVKPFKWNALHFDANKTAFMRKVLRLPRFGAEVKGNLEISYSCFMCTVIKFQVVNDAIQSSSSAAFNTVQYSNDMGTFNRLIQGRYPMPHWQSGVHLIEISQMQFI